MFNKRKKQFKTIITFFCFWLVSTFILLMLRKPTVKEISWGNNQPYQERIIPGPSFFDNYQHKMLQALAITLILATIYYMIIGIIKEIKKPSSQL